MSRKPTQVGVVTNVTNVIDEEVDEITEQDAMGEMVPDGLHPHDLDDFLRELHETTSLEANGLPNLQFLKRHFKSKSATIRYLHHKGHSVKQISKHLGLRYQHVRNVLTTELKRGPNEIHILSEDETRRISPGLDKV